jgi:hypothetical protein
MSAPDLREIGVGMLGYGFRGKAHSNAYRKIAYVTWPPPLLPRLVEDGYRAAVVCDAIVRSAESGRREDIVYR